MSLGVFDSVNLPETKFCQTLSTVFGSAGP
jgi:hypothetical protein